jgi:hypothetical protein
LENQDLKRDKSQNPRSKLAMSDKNESKKFVLDKLSGDLVDEHSTASEDRKESIDYVGGENEEREERSTTQENVRYHILSEL